MPLILVVFFGCQHIPPKTQPNRTLSSILPSLPIAGLSPSCSFPCFLPAPSSPFPLLPPLPPCLLPPFFFPAPLSVRVFHRPPHVISHSFGFLATNDHPNTHPCTAKVVGVPPGHLVRAHQTPYDPAVERGQGAAPRALRDTHHSCQVRRREVTAVEGRVVGETDPLVLCAGYSSFLPSEER